MPAGIPPKAPSIVVTGILLAACPSRFQLALFITCQIPFKSGGPDSAGTAATLATSEEIFIDGVEDSCEQEMRTDSISNEVPISFTARLIFMALLICDLWFICFFTYLANQAE